MRLHIQRASTNGRTGKGAFIDIHASTLGISSVAGSVSIELRRFPIPSAPSALLSAEFGIDVEEDLEPATCAAFAAAWA